MSVVRDSWSALSSARAKEYLKGYGHPSETSKRLLAEVIEGRAAGGRVSVLDLGCGNAHLFGFLAERGLDLSYTGVDFSEPLLEAAREAFAGDARIKLVQDDLEELGSVSGSFDVAVYSHVVEMLESPGRSLVRAAELADAIAIRFFEPPEHEFDTAEIRWLDTGDGKQVPYLRRSMSRDHYASLLTRLACSSVDVYRDEATTDQVHVLHYGKG